jgi:hypothetical protein
MIKCLATTIIFFVALAAFEIGFYIIKKREDPFVESPNTITID